MPSPFSTRALDGVPAPRHSRGCGQQARHSRPAQFHVKLCAMDWRGTDRCNGLDGIPDRGRARGCASDAHWQLRPSQVNSAKRCRHLDRLGRSDRHPTHVLTWVRALGIHLRADDLCASSRRWTVIASAWQHLRARAPDVHLQRRCSRETTCWAAIAAVGPTARRQSTPQRGFGVPDGKRSSVTTRARNTRSSPTTDAEQPCAASRTVSRETPERLHPGAGFPPRILSYRREAAAVYETGTLRHRQWSCFRPPHQRRRARASRSHGSFT